MARTAPVPNIPAIPGMNPGVFVMGGGGGGGGSGGPGGGAGAGRQGAGGGSGGNQAQGGGKGAPDPQRYPLCGTKSHPVDVATGRAFTHPILIVELPGPLPLQLTRSYSAHAHGRNVGLGWGWAHSLGWRVEEHRRSVDVWTDQGTRVSFPKSLRAGDDVVSSFGFRLRREPWGYVVDPNDGRLYAFSEKLGEHLYLLTAIEDRNKNRIALVYENGQLVEVTDSAGRKLRVRRDGAGHIASFEVKNALEQGRWIALERYNYDARGRLVGATDADGFSARYEYDNEARLTADVDRAGLCFHFVYDAQGRCIESWGDYLSSPDPSLDPDVPSVLASDRHPARGVHHCVFEYLDEDYTHVIDSTHVGHFAHNALGLLTMAHDAGRSPVRAEYDARGFLAVLEHPDGGFERFERDGRGNLLGYTNQLGARTSIVRDEAGSPVEITDPVGGVTHIFRDARGNPEHIANPLRQTTTYRHDERGLLRERIDPNGARTSYQVDAQGNLTAVASPNGAVWRFRYDALGRVTGRTDPAGAETRFIYSARGDLIEVIDAQGGVSRYQYDGERHLVRAQNPSGHVTEWGWGGYHRLCWRKDANGHVARLLYNREGELTTVVNELGEKHQLLYDIFGRLIEERTFDGRVLRYRLDAAGRPTRVTTGESMAAEAAGPAVHTDLAYDLAGRLVQRTTEAGDEHFEHDMLGNLIEARWPGGHIELARDPLGQIVKETQVLGGEAHAVEAQYDALGNRISRRTTLGHSEAIARDAMGLRVRTVLDGAALIEHGLDPLGREVFRRLSGGGAIGTSYDPLGRLSQQRVTRPAERPPIVPGHPAWVGELPDAVVALISYRHDLTGELVARSGGARGATELRYDPVGQLLAMTPEVGRREIFRYDPAGNLHEGDGAPERRYGRGGKLLRKGSTEYRWDAEGRLVERREDAGGDKPRVYRYGWSGAGLLDHVEAPDGARVEFEYDPLARRVRKRVLAWDEAAGALRLARETRFVWDGDVLVHEITRSPAQSAAAPGGAAASVRTYCFMDDSFVPAAHREADGRWVHYVNDPVGTPEHLLDDAGAIVGSLERRAFGIEAPRDGGASTPLRFPGQYEDAETGLYYNRYRYYDPADGMFVSPDPLGVAGGSGYYGYAVNPFAWIDPFGLASLREAERLLEDSENRSFGNNVGHARAHVPGPGQDPAALATSRPTKQTNTVFRSRNQALRSLRDIMTRDDAALRSLAPGQVHSGSHTPRETLEGLESKSGQPAQRACVNRVTYSIGRLPNGQLHLLHFAPRQS